MTVRLERDVVLWFNRARTVLPRGTEVEVVRLTDHVARIRYRGQPDGEPAAIVGADAVPRVPVRP